MKPHRILTALLATILAATCLAPFGPARADIFPPAGMNPNASNATLPQARTNLGAAAGNGANVATDYGADPTGTVDSTSAIANAVAAVCNSASPVFQTREVFIPAGIYKVSGSVPATNACWIHGQGPLGGGKNAGATVLRMTNACAAGDLFPFRGFGQLHISNIQFDTSGGYCNGGASYARVQAGGASYAVNDTITLTGGTFTTAAVLKVTAVSAGAVTGVVIQTPGTYSVAPSSVAAVAQGSTSGVGTGATFNVVYANAAAISVSGPTTILSADAASGATSLTVASIAGFTNGDQISIEQDNGVYFTTTISGAPSGTTITLAAGLTFKASANHPVYDAYATAPLIDNVVCNGLWDCLRIENANNVTVRDFYAQDFGHDAIIKTSGPVPDNGQDRYQLTAWDQQRGTSNASVEFLAGGDVAVSEKSKLLGSNYNVLLNSYFGPTGTLLIEDNSIEQSKVCAIRLHQSVSGVEYGNVAVVGNQLSHLAGATSSQNFCVDAGTPTTAPKWVRNVNFSHNIVNDVVTAAVSAVSVQDGDNVVVAGNNLGNNSVAGPTAISIGGAATHAVEFGNTIVGFTTGSYGTMLDSAFSPVVLRGGMQSLFNTAALQTGYACNNADGGGAGCQITFNNAATTPQTIASQYQSGNWHLNFTVGGGTTYLLRLRNDGKAIFPGLANVETDASALLTVNGGLLAQASLATKTSNYQIVALDSGRYFDNTGAVGEVDFTLPAYAAGLRYCFTVTAAQILKVIAPASNKIAIGTTNSAAAGNITANAGYSSTCLIATTVSNQWAAEQATGTWTVN